jgi:D-3-phosphoglycerate dehydrogenase / 2-oxoglutarate reductase
MLGQFDRFVAPAAEMGLRIHRANVAQTLSGDELCELLPRYDGWIIGDDPATKTVFETARAGRLRAAVKWGVGTDNVDFIACEELGIPITNTPMMFGAEVADVALGYVIALARETFEIDQGVRNNEWPKLQGVSLAGKTAAIIGQGDIGRNTAKRLMACEMNIIGYDPGVSQGEAEKGVRMKQWPKQLEEADFIVITAALTRSSRHMLNGRTLKQAKQGVRVVNVARGPIIDENELEKALANEKVYSAALDVFETEPLPSDSELRRHSRCIFGSHNASNTKEAGFRTSMIAMTKLAEFLGTAKSSQT